MMNTNLAPARIETNDASHKNGKTRIAGIAAFRVEVTAKSAFPDAAGFFILAQLPHLGIQGVAAVHVSRLYGITGRLTPSQLTAVAQHLLADPITQDFQTDGPRPAHSHSSKKNWRIEVWLKPAVSDVVGESVRKAIADLNLPTPETVRCGTAYTFEGRLSQALAEKIAVKVLANPIVHRFSITPC